MNDGWPIPTHYAGAVDANGIPQALCGVSNVNRWVRATAGDGVDCLDCLELLDRAAAALSKPVPA